MLERLLRNYRRKGILIDTNLLIGLLVGLLDPNRLADCRATKTFTKDEFLLLNSFVSRFDKIVTTPHILTEVSNLAGMFRQPLLGEFRGIFQVLVENFLERPLPAAEIAKVQDFLSFGLTDTAITMIAPGSYLVLTDDFPLYGLLRKKEVDVINFNHIRVLAWT